MTKKEAMCLSHSHESGVEGRMVSLSEMKAFSNHPYHVEKDAAMLELVDSIQTEMLMDLSVPVQCLLFIMSALMKHRIQMNL